MKYIKGFFSRAGVVATCVIIQIVWSYIVIIGFSQYSTIISIILRLVSILVVLGMIKREKNVTNNLPWMFIIILAPVFGGLMYLICGANFYTSPTIKKLNLTRNKLNSFLIQDKRIIEEIEKQDEAIASQIKYISNYSNYPIYKNKHGLIKYFKLGDEVYPEIIENLKKAKKFIFIEFFIIEKGKFWNSILEVLEQKVKEGVDVRIIYDDIGCAWTLPYHYDRFLESKGIKCVVFNRMIPLMAVFMNNRDHRKILDIDGDVAFSGGFNLADEYINEVEKYGHWKDNAIMIKGEPVWNYTIMFLKTWNTFRKNDNKHYDYYRPTKNYSRRRNDGFIEPYGENPLDNENIGENIYLNILNQAKKYVHIFTPYLIIDSELSTALALAVKRGVSVKIVTPGIPDKIIVNQLTKSYYYDLIKEGVEIYEYTPGFIHSKVFVSDDKVATVGTLNLDYRSLYTHFECGNYIYDASVIKDIKDDTDETIKKSHKITINELKHGFFKEVFQSMLRIFAPLL